MKQLRSSSGTLSLTVAFVITGCGLPGEAPDTPEPKDALTSSGGSSGSSAAGGSSGRAASSGGGGSGGSAGEAGANQNQGGQPTNNGGSVGVLPSEIFDPAHCDPFAAAAGGVAYYVDSLAGDDSRSGTSEAQAWKSLYKVQQAELMPGDVVRLKRGSSWDTGLTLTRGGAEGQPLAIEAYGEGPAPIISLPGKFGYSCVWIDAPYVVLRGLHVQDVVSDGIKLTANSHDSVICGNELSDVGLGVVLEGTGHRVLYNYAHDLHIAQNTAGGDDDFGAVGFAINGGANHELAYNRCIDCSAPSLDYGLDGGAFETYTNVSNVKIHHNWAERTCGFLELGAGTATGVEVAYNVFLDGTQEQFLGMSFGGKFVGDYFVVASNNTIVNRSARSEGGAVLGFWGAPPAADRVTFRNNVVYTSSDLTHDATFTHDHNLYFLADDGWLGIELGEGESNANPNFVDLGQADLRLGANSPARDAGITPLFDSDIRGQAVPTGAGPDLGAFEAE